MQSAFLPAGNGLCRVQPVLVDPHDLAGLHVTYDLGADQVECARLGRDDPVVAEQAERERPEAEGVTERDEHVVDESGHGVRALEPAHRVRDRLGERSASRARRAQR